MKASEKSGQRPHVEIDHRQLLGLIKRRRTADQSEARVVDHVLRLKIAGRQYLFEMRHRTGFCDVERNDQRHRRAAGPAISAASAFRRSSRRATSTSAWPFFANTRASAVPIPADAPVMIATGASSAARPLGNDALAQGNPLARRNAEQVGDTPDQVFLKLGDAAVGVDHLPHHLDEAQAALFVELAHQQAGEAIEVAPPRARPPCACAISCSAVSSSSWNPRLHQQAQFSRSASPKSPSTVAAWMSSAGARNAAVVGAEAIGMFVAAGKVRDEVLDGLEHGRGSARSARRGAAQKPALHAECDPAFGNGRRASREAF